MRDVEGGFVYCGDLWGGCVYSSDVGSGCFDSGGVEGGCCYFGDVGVVMFIVVMLGWLCLYWSYWR